MNESKFYGVLPALATPLNGDNRTVNTEVVKDIIEYHLSCGADAGIGSTYNVMLPEFVQIYDAVQKNDISKAREIQMKVNRVINVMLKHEIIPSVKRACELIGFPVGNATFPMRHMSDEQKALFDAEIEKTCFPFMK